jgi:transglutaminase-like putative cysteine protease
LIREQLPGYRLIRQEVTLNLEAEGQVYWTGILLRADTPLEVTYRARDAQDALVDLDQESVFAADLIAAAAETDHYTAESLVLQPGEDALRQSRPVYPDWVAERYLALPDSVPERVRALARDLTASASTPYDRAVAIESYLRQFPYSLDVPGPPVGRCGYFCSTSGGYCGRHHDGRDAPPDCRLCHQVSAELDGAPPV